MFLSVIIPVYNAAPYLRRCINSVVAQDMGGELELLLTDDGRTDASGTVCHAHSSKYGWIHTFHIANGGVGAARNYGVERVRGEYFTFIDVIDPGLYKEALRLHGVQPADLYVFGYKDYPARHGGRHSVPQRFYAGGEALAQLYLQMKQDYLMFPVYNKIFKTGDCGRCRFATGIHYYEDYLFSLDCLKNVKTAWALDMAAYNYVHHGKEHLGGKHTEPDVVVAVAREIKRRSELLFQTKPLAECTLLEYYNNLLHSVDCCGSLKQRTVYIRVLLDEFKKYGHKEDFRRFLGRRRMLLSLPTVCGVLVMCYLRIILLKLSH